MKKILLAVTLLTTGFTGTTQLFANTVISASGNVPPNVLNAFTEVEAQYAAEGKILSNPVWSHTQNVYTVVFDVVDAATGNYHSCRGASFKGSGVQVY